MVLEMGIGIIFSDTDTVFFSFTDKCCKAEKHCVNAPSYVNAVERVK